MGMYETTFIMLGYISIFLAIFTVAAIIADKIVAPIIKYWSSRHGK